MLRSVVVLLGVGLAAACASSKPGGTCDPAAEACACDGATPCPDGYLCGPGGTCVIDVDAGPDIDATPIDAIPLRQFGEPCLDNDECDSNICIFVGTGGRCTRLCDSDCPADWGCFGVVDVIDPGQVDNVCVPVVDQLCTACTGDAECTQLGMDRCLTYPDGDQYCSRDCRQVGCPVGYTCTDLTIAGNPARQCIPNSGACDCNATNQGMMETCTITTPFATTCAGMRTCTGVTGWGSCQPPATTDDPDGGYLDSNCDGIDGDVTRGVFVAGGGANTASCGLISTMPCQTISHGIIRAVQSGRNHVFVQAGTYNETVVLVNGINVWGGYDFGWQRASYATPGHTVTITGALDNTSGGDGEYLGVRAHDLFVPVTLGDLVIQGPAASGAVGGNGRSSYAVHVDAATVNLTRVRIEAGPGANGVAGTSGTDAVIVDAQPYMNGGRGGDGREYNTVCDTSGRGGGGSAGTNTCTSSPSTRALAGGGGGAGGLMDTDCGITGACSAFGNCDAQPGANGGAAAFRMGSFGAPGLGGSGLSSCGPTTGGGPGLSVNGAAGTRNLGGAINANGYWYGRGGNAGGTGENGSGGGGGGGAGGCDLGTDSYGAGGGGGGAGGCAARSGGGGGGGGGASIGVFAVNGSTVTIAGCALARGAAGAGGAGGSGGRGQSPGTGNVGGNPQTGDAATPGTGGNGAHGGHGGGGAGGQGGRSIGLAWTPGSSITSDCTFTGGAGGMGGAAGVHAPTAPAGERDGNDGEAGASGAIQTTRACASATDC